MSTERHPSKYAPKHRPKRQNKVQRGKKLNSGSKFDKKLLRHARLKKRSEAEAPEPVMDELPLERAGVCGRCLDNTTFALVVTDGEAEWSSACCGWPEVNLPEEP